MPVVGHPIMFEDDDPLLARVREIAGTFPGSDEKASHGRPAFFTKKIFAYYSASVRKGNGWVQHPHAIIVLCDTDDRHALLGDDRSFIPAYLGASGWIGIDLDDATDWREVAELVDASYRLTASKRHIIALDSLT